MLMHVAVFLRMFGAAATAWWDDDAPRLGASLYYSCQILLFGAEFTRVYAENRGRQPKPESFAEKDPDAVKGA